MSDTIARLNAASGLMGNMTPVGGTRLQPMTEFGSNPGALTAWKHVPASDDVMPLVVVLHGCTQNAAGYDRGSGWSVLADRFGFAVLFAEQTRANNPNGCFNWFQPGDVQRDGGEALSIRQMIAALVEREAIDPTRVFVTGLSAGGAMTSVMLATYPEVFAGGAIIAGLPHGAATSVPQAFDRMRGHGHDDEARAADLVRGASPHRGRWPAVSVWHGTGDATVADINAERILGQWRAVQGLGERPDMDESIGTTRHRVWHGADGAVALEDYRIPGMGHGTPLRTDGDTASGTPMPYMLEAGISSTWHIAQGWGLLGEERAALAPALKTKPAAKTADQSASQASGVQATIEAALRSAGLMR